MRRIILHIDMDYFFAQIEERENPQFKGKPVVVGADPKGGQGRGVVSTCNYIARKYGIHSALPISKAHQLCPNAIFLPVNMELYQKVSEKIMRIVERYSPLFEQVSLDEAYLDLSTKWTIVKLVDGRKGWEKAEIIAKKMKEEILEKEKLTSTIGIGPNKLIAKIASEKGKPNGLLIIKPNQVKKFLEPLDIEDLPGIGPKTAEKLRAIGINEIGELKRLSKIKLKDMFGVVGETFYEKARGIDEEPVISEEIIKSISESASWRTKGKKRFISSTGRQITFEKDTRDSEIIFENFEQMIKEVHQELLKNNFSFKTITVVCRYRGFETHTKSKTLKEATQDLGVLKKEAKKLLLRFMIENPKLIRLIGLRVKIS
jgi:DNA polymerase IV (DinB-like DNA polymerase)